MNIIKLATIIILGACQTTLLYGYVKSTEVDQPVVRNKLFPKKSEIEIAPLSIGGVLNQSYVETNPINGNSLLLQGSVAYFWSEDWGLSFDYLYFINADKAERTCIENFYNRRNGESGVPCAADGLEPTQGLLTSTGELGTSNLGPVYPPIRELNFVISLSSIWTSIYGKQLLLMTNTIYFDLYTAMGAGLAFSDYFPDSKYYDLGKGAGPQPYRGAETEENPQECQTPGICPTAVPDYQNYIGINGRPIPEAQITPAITLGIGQKFHFAQRFQIKLEIRNYTLLGTANGFEAFFMVYGGLGVRF
jgi:outer membrane beta-barrel protein